MVSGPTEVSEPHKTEVNRQLVQVFVEEVLINRNLQPWLAILIPTSLSITAPRQKTAYLH
jgi:hypothetical protein